MKASTFPTHPITRRDLLWLAAILLTAAVLRLGRPDVLHFKFDQATQAILAQDLASGTSLPLLGPQSGQGLPHSPMSVYFLAPVFFLTHSAQAVTLAIGLWNVVGVGLLWLLAARYVGRRVAILAGFAYAASPYAVLFSRSIWVPTAHTPVILLALLLILYGFHEGKRWAQAASIPVLLTGLQVHYAAWTLLPLVLWLVWLGRAGIDWRRVTVGLALGVVVLLPFAVGLYQISDGNLANLFDSVNDLGPLRLRDKVWVRYLPLLTGIGFHGMGGDAAQDLWAVNPVPEPLWALVGVLTVLGGGVALVVRRFRTLAVPLFLWILLPLLVFWPNFLLVFAHYFIPSLPALALCVGIGVVALLDGIGALAARFKLPARAAWMGRAVIVGALAVALASQGIWYFGMLDFVNEHYTAGAFSTPLRMSMAVAGALAPYDDVLILGAQSAYSGHQVWRALLYDTASSVREVAITQGGLLVFPAGPFAVLTAPRALPYPGEEIYATDSTLIFHLRPGGEGEYRIDTFEEAPAWNGPPLQDLGPVRFANGVTLTGYTLEDGRLYVGFTLPGAPEPRYMRWFAHFLDADGERIGQYDVDFWPGHHWREGDRLIAWVDVEEPAEMATIRFGLYVIEDGSFRNIDVLDDANNPAAPWFDLGVGE